jgi:hypothetical protein
MVDLGNRPDGATHYAETQSGTIYYKITNGVVVGVWSKPFCFWNKPIYSTDKKLKLMFGDKFKEIPMKKEESDLDVLARNVHKWPKGMELLYVWNNLVAVEPTSEVAKYSSAWNREQWLTRRAELQNKPSWKDAPEWAATLAQHATGWWTWFSCLPNQNDNGFWVDGGMQQSSGLQGEVIGNWRVTLERRPAESVAATQPQSDVDSWFERGELPPVGASALRKRKDFEWWTEVLIVGAGKHRVIFRLKDGRETVGTWSDFEFKPATERQRTITGMVDIMIGTPANDNLTATERLTAVASAIYDKFISKQGGEA